MGAVGGRVLLSDGTLQEAGSIIWKDGSSYGVGRDLPGDAISLRFRRRVEYCSALNFLVRRDIWNEVGGLDEEYFPAYYEDVDFCFKIAERGDIVLYEPRSVVRHLESRSSTQLYKEFLCLTHRKRLIEKWPEVFERNMHAEPIDPDSVEEAIHLAMGSPTAGARHRRPVARSPPRLWLPAHVRRCARGVGSRLSGVCVSDHRDHRRP